MQLQIKNLSNHLTEYEASNILILADTEDIIDYAIQQSNSKSEIFQQNQNKNNRRIDRF